MYIVKSYSWKRHTWLTPIEAIEVETPSPSRVENIPALKNAFAAISAEIIDASES